MGLGIQGGDRPIPAITERAKRPSSEGSKAPAGSTLAPDAFRPQRGLSPEQKLRAERLTSLFENSTFELQYAYSEALGDGRGITAGRAGFTSATGDMLDVVQAYTRQQPNNPLARYLPRLKQLAAKESPDTKGLEGLGAAWAQSAKDPAFRKVQDAVVDKLYYAPAVRHADELGLRSPLSRAVLYDTIIQHGDGGDPDGLPALIKQTSDRVHGTPKTGVDERTWLKAFLDVRRSDLAHASDPATRDCWAESVGRVDALKQIESSGNYDLQGPIHLHTSDYQVTVP